ncbi:MAG: glycerol-3-phosphate acyltransferase [Phycisphaerae bacterium]|nr:glycerol-3-phosphate acyltransferase [Phycisphaerae bacterium]
MKAVDVFAVLFSYGLGCLTTGYYLVRWTAGQDIRRLNSGSVGARNVGRVLGQWGYWTTLTADILRGALAVAAVRWLGASTTALALSVSAVAAGHIFPVQLAFHGGKGIAVAFGALLVWDYRIAGVWVFSFAVLYLFSRRYMFSGILSIPLIVLSSAAFGHPPVIWISLMFLTGLILTAHRRNIAELFHTASGRREEGSKQ